jgi:CYTH domain-containing protein
VDEFHGRLKGLVLAELELPREDQPYVKPHFVGEEVTGNPRYYNANM